MTQLEVLATFAAKRDFVARTISETGYTPGRTVAPSIAISSGLHGRVS